MRAEFDWKPTIGDPTVVGWTTVALYLVAAWLCLRALHTEKRGPPRPLRETVPALWRVVRRHWPHPPVPALRSLIWLSMACALLFLGINKQFDLQSLFTEVARVSAHAGGWYEQRRALQLAFVLAIAGCAVAAMAALWRITRGPLRDLRLPIFGFFFILAFVVVRASSFHKMDAVIGISWAGVRMNWLLELGGILLIIWGAARRLRSARGGAASARARAE